MADIGHVPPRLSTHMANAVISASAILIPVVSTARFVAPMELLITRVFTDGDGQERPDQGYDAELVWMDQTPPDGTTLKVSSATMRGQTPTVARSHDGAPGDIRVMAVGPTERHWDALRQELASIVPTGTVVMWSGTVAAIPAGWALCNGLNGTPDLRDRFVVGAGGAYNPGNTGGADTVALTTAQIPSHAHTASVSGAGAHNHAVKAYSSDSGNHSHGGLQAFHRVAGPPLGAGGSSFDMGTGTSPVYANGDHGHSVVIGNTGSSSSHENRPPYYALAYIMKVAS